MAPDPAGPFVSMAVFCSRLDRQPDGTVDVIGVVDGVSLSGDDDPGGDTFDASAPVVRLLGLVSLRAGDARGRHTLSLKAHFPDGELGATLTRNIELTDQRRARRSASRSSWKRATPAPTGSTSPTTIGCSRASRWWSSAASPVRPPRPSSCPNRPPA